MIGDSKTQRVHVSFQHFVVAVLIACASIGCSTEAFAQARLKSPDADRAADASDAVDEAVKDNDDNNNKKKRKYSVAELSKTQRGRELLYQLRLLRNSESAMGEKHPLLPQIKEQIEQVKGLLRNRIVAEEIAKEMDDEDEAKQLVTVLPGMADDDLRRLVLRLMGRVDSLEKEVKALKNDDEVKNSEADDEPLTAPVEEEATEEETTEAADNESSEKSDDDLFSGGLFDDT